MTQARDLGDAANKANFLDNVTSDLNVAGMIIPFGGTTAPSGWLACDGSVVSRTTYAPLFAAIGTTWGVGDGSTTFAVPDLRGAFLRGTGLHGTEAMATNTSAFFQGPSVGGFENDQMQDHKHAFDYGPAEFSATGSGISVDNLAASITNSTTERVDELVERDSQGTPRVGDETRPFNAGVLYCIKT